MRKEDEEEGEEEDGERGRRKMRRRGDCLFFLMFNSLDLGCAFTRFQTMRLCKAFPHILEGQLISYGPCQFPTLGFVVERVSDC